MRRQSREFKDTIPIGIDLELADNLDGSAFRKGSLRLSQLEPAPVENNSHTNNLALFAVGFVSCIALGALWCSSTPDGCSADNAELIFFTRVTVGVLLFLTLWWTQRHRAKEVATTLQKELPRYARRLPRIVIKIEPYCEEPEDEEIDEKILSGDKALDLSLHDDMSSSTSSGDDEDDGFESCVERSPTSDSGCRAQRKLRALPTPASSSNEPQGLFHRVPKAQRDAALKYLSKEQEQLIRDLAAKLTNCDAGYLSWLRKNAVQDPDEAIAEFGRHSNGFDIGAYRFLSAHAWKIKIAEEKILNTIRWRTLELPKYMKNPQVLQELIDRRLIPNIGWDKESRGCFAADSSPLEYWALQLADLKNAYAVLGEEGVKCGYVQYLETREATVRESNSLGMFVILDCIDVPMSTLMLQVSYFKKFVAFVGSVGEVYYPECITKLVMANAPSFIDYVWKIAKAALSEATKAKVVVADNMDIVGENCDMRDVERLKQTIISVTRQGKK